MSARADAAGAERDHARAVGARVARLFDEHSRMVLGMCRVLLRDPQEAEDAAQQTFLSAYRSLLGGTEPVDASRWLAAIARNECRARIRKRMVTPPAVPLSETLESADDPVTAARQRQGVADMRAAVEKLPPRQREALVLRDFYGLSYQDVATALSVTPPVVEALLSRARKRVKELAGQVPSAACGAIQVPLALREHLAREIPGFEAALAAVGLGGGGATVGVLAKVAAMPATAKLAAATAAVAVGAGATSGVTRLLDGPAGAPEVARAAASSGQGSARGPVADHERVPGARLRNDALPAAAADRRRRVARRSAVRDDGDRRRARRGGTETRDRDAETTSVAPPPAVGAPAAASGVSGPSGPTSVATAPPPAPAPSSSGSSGPSVSSGASENSGSGSTSSGPSENSGSGSTSSGPSASSGSGSGGSSSGDTSGSSGSGSGSSDSGSSGSGSGSSGSGSTNSESSSSSSGSSGSGSSGSGSSGSSGSGSGSSGSGSGSGSATDDD